MVALHTRVSNLTKNTEQDWDGTVSFPAPGNITVKSQALSIGIFDNMQGGVSITLNNTSHDYIDLTPENALILAAGLSKVANDAAATAITK